MASSKHDALTEFTKTKMHFALALLGTLFALHPFVEKFEDRGFFYLDYELKIFYAYALIAALLALTVYFYAVALLSERAYGWMEKGGNFAYAIAIMVLPLYGGLYLSTLLAERIGQAHLAVAPPTVALGLGLGWFVLSYLLAWRLRKRMGDQDRSAKVDELAESEIAALARSQDMFAADHYDLSVIEAWKAIEARLRRVLLLRRARSDSETPEAMVRAATRAKIVTPANQKLLEELRNQWNVAVSTEPLTREAAESALAITRNVLATIPIESAPERKRPSG